MGCPYKSEKKLKEERSQTRRSCEDGRDSECSHDVIKAENTGCQEKPGEVFLGS